MKLTVNHNKNSLDYIEVGEMITLEKEPTNPNDNKAIRAYYQQQFIGYVSVSGSTICPGTISGHDAFDSMENVVEAKVVDHGTVTSSRGGASRITLIVTVGESETEQTSITEEDIKMTFKVKGSANKFKGKAAVLEEFKNKNVKVFLDLALSEDGEVVVSRQEGDENERLAGKIEEKELSNCSSLDDLQLVKDLLTSGTELEAKVSKVTGASYFISLQISADTINTCKSEIAKVAIDEKKKELIDMGFEEETLTEIEEYLSANNFSAVEIQNIFDTYKIYPDDVQFRIIKKPKTLFKDEFGALKVAYAAMMNQFNVLCSGDKGTGKNVMIQTWAWITQRPLFELSVSRETDKLDILGSRTINSEVEDGNVINSIEFSTEALIDCMECGGILNIDEINFADPGVTGVLHAICDDRRAIEVPGYKKVIADDTFMIMATMNVDYQGTNELNEALADRFVDIVFPANKSIFEVLSLACPNAAQSDIQKVDKVYQKMYSIIQDRDSQLDSNCISVRGPIQALKMSNILGLRKAMEVCVADKVKDEEYRSNIKSIIDNLI